MASLGQIGMRGIEYGVTKAQESTPSPRRTLPIGRIVVGVLAGGALGVLGLPRLELPFAMPFAQSPGSMVQEAPTPAPPRVLLDERFIRPLANWPNDPAATAWFVENGFRVYAREPDRFVAVGVPLAQPVGNAVLTAQFQKIGGPPGGGYGLIVRDQGSATQRVGRNQEGQYIVLEVGDRGDVGVWRRDETRWVDVIPWKHSNAVHTAGEPNALTVTLRSSALKLEINGQMVADASYQGIPDRGGVGIFVGGDFNDVILNWLRIEIS
jgi:hypothetical protein